jgi:hypothetical protein
MATNPPLLVMNGQAYVRADAMIVMGTITFIGPERYLWGQDTPRTPEI